MNLVGLIMAGGRSERMRAGGDLRHKALREVGGVSLLQRNLDTLLAIRPDRIAIAVAASEPAVLAFANDVARERCGARAIPCDIIVERHALGNIGAARLACGGADHVLVVYVDNLDTIDLADLVAAHIRGGRAATIATHLQTFRDPYGELTILGDEVTGYTEKPVRTVIVSSGTCVLSRRACEAIPPDSPVAAHELFALLRARGETVGAYRHEATWVDVNDETAMRRAEELLA
jgi:NDP-sugar pyrophosphorylase family protein